MSDQKSGESDDSGKPSEPGEKPIIDDDVKKNVRSRNTWLRLFYMLLFALIMALAEFVLACVVIVQFFTVLITSERNEKLRDFGADLSLYIYDIWRYLSFVSESQPFPLNDWRTAEQDSSDPDASGA